MEEQRQKSWIARNWGCMIGGGCLALVLLFVFGIGTVVFGGIYMFKSSEPYEYAFEQASSNQELISAIGEPIEKDGMIEGSLGYKNRKSSADFKIPLKGPQGKAFVYIKGEKLEDFWEYEEFFISIKDSTERINLLDKALDGD